MVGLGLTASTATIAFSPMWSAPTEQASSAEGSEEAGAGALTMERLPDGTLMTMERLPDGTLVESGTATMRVVPEEAAGMPTWTIAAGDHLWHVAEATLAEAWARPPSAPETTPYWQAIVELNRPRLADPANPDLVYPGQVFDLPRPPSAPT